MNYDDLPLAPPRLVATIRCCYLAACAVPGSIIHLDLLQLTTLTSTLQYTQVWVRLYLFRCCCFPAQQHYGQWQHRAAALRLARRFAMHVVNSKAGT